MLQIIPKVSLLNAHEELKEKIKSITLRGYANKPPVIVTGELYSHLQAKRIKPLSVNDITTIFCPPRRDVYMKHVVKPQDKPNWGRITGQLVESCIAGFTDKYKNDGKVGRIRKYENLARLSARYVRDFAKSNNRKVSELGKYKNTPEEDETWLLAQLDYALRHELVMLRATKALSGHKSEQASIQHFEIKPNSNMLGISSPSTPDFIIPAFSAIGDIKTGIEFKDYFRLTAAGYALAYENQMGKGHDINLGLIYYFPTRQKDISFAHLYMFVIDDVLRQEFLHRRDEALLVLRDAQANPAKLPAFAEREKHCIYCKYLDNCDQLRRR